MKYILVIYLVLALVVGVVASLFMRICKKPNPPIR
jgi:hypothetical protein